MSRGEAHYCDVLAYHKKCKEIKSYESQVKFSMDINGHHICNHYVDFLVVLPDGTKQVQEYKGVRTGIWQIKRKLFEALYPDIEYVVINHREKPKWTASTKRGSGSSSGRRKRKVRPKRNF